MGSLPKNFRMVFFNCCTNFVEMGEVEETRRRRERDGKKTGKRRDGGGGNGKETGRKSSVRKEVSNFLKVNVRRVDPDRYIEPLKSQATGQCRVIAVPLPCRSHLLLDVVVDEGIVRGDTYLTVIHELSIHNTPSRHLQVGRLGEKERRRRRGRGNWDKEIG